MISPAVLKSSILTCKSQYGKWSPFPPHFLVQGHCRRGRGHVKWWLLIAAATRTRLRNALKQSSARASQDRWRGQQGLGPLVLMVILPAPSSPSLSQKYSDMTWISYLSKWSQVIQFPPESSEGVCHVIQMFLFFVLFLTTQVFLKSFHLKKWPSAEVCFTPASSCVRSGGVKWSLVWRGRSAEFSPTSPAGRASPGTKWRPQRWERGPSECESHAAATLWRSHNTKWL